MSAVATPVFVPGVISEEKGLLACLTEQILWGRLEVEEARQIVLRHLRYQQEALRRPRLVAGGRGQGGPREKSLAPGTYGHGAGHHAPGAGWKDGAPGIERGEVRGPQVRRVILLFVLALFGWSVGRMPAQQQNCQPWRFLVGIQTPPSSAAASKVTLYFKPMPSVKPICEVTFAVREAAIVDVQQGFVTIAGRPDTRVDIGCTLPEGKPR